MLDHIEKFMPDKKRNSRIFTQPALKSQQCPKSKQTSF